MIQMLCELTSWKAHLYILNSQRFTFIHLVGDCTRNFHSQEFHINLSGTECSVLPFQTPT